MSDAIPVLVRKEGDHWVAQCIDFGISAQASDLETLESQVEDAIQAQNLVGQAPQYFFDIMPALLPRYLE